MKLKLLLLLLVISGAAYAQVAYKNLIFSEVRMDEHHFTYAEITNMGDKTIDLSEFEVGSIGPWTQPWNAGVNERIRLPKKDLKPGQSFVLATIWDLPDKMVKIDPERWNGRRRTTYEIRKLADLGLYPPETDNGNFPALDSVSPGHNALSSWGGRNVFYIRHFMTATDSVVTDAVNAIFTSTTSPYKTAGASDVAGVTRGTATRTLVRKFSVKQGVGDALDSWTAAAGVDVINSEWLPIPLRAGSWGAPERKEFWTVGNHGNFRMNVTTLNSESINVDFANKTLTVPFGVRNGDSIMSRFQRVPGVAWEYKFSGSRIDSFYTSARTGDSLTLYACGNQLDVVKFRIIAAPATKNNNMVVPKYQNYSPGNWGIPFVVTENIPVIDTVRNVPFATRVDTLLKYLEKPDIASWKILFVDNIARPDLKTGDKLQVTSQSGMVKNYFIKVEKYLPSHNANLSAITWPDIPAEYRGLFGWTQDTIPNFVPSKLEYTIDIPGEVEGIPALIPFLEDLDARVEVKRAASLSGSAVERSIIFNTTAEDDTTHLTYKVTLNKLKAEDDIQPYLADPFISQFVWQDQWANGFIEAANPGNQMLDMSKYMFCFGYVNDPAGAITRLSATGDWGNRYGKYIPGYKWVDQAKWETQPAMVVQDLNVNPIVYPGDVFVIGDIRGTGQSGYPWWASRQCDVDFGHMAGGETINNWSALQQWNGANWYLFRIDNDSIVKGLKPANDPKDFTLIDVFGSGDGSAPVVGGAQMQQTTAYTRKPEIYKGNDQFKGSFGTNAATSEWLKTDRPYWGSKGYGWPNDILMICDGLGSHFMHEVTIYKSTIASLLYKVSEGYSKKESIRGMKTGITAANFLASILKSDPAQVLTLKKAGTGAVLTGTAVLNLNDTLVVVSADAKNITKYVLSVTPDGLSPNALLTSTNYTITVAGNKGTISGFPYGTNLSTVLGNVKKPVNTLLTIVNASDAYVSLKRLNYDTLYVDTKVNDQIFFEVLAEDGATKIKYQLLPTVTPSEAFVTSDLYKVDQTTALISLVPRGTAVASFLKNVYPCTGATYKLIDKAGFDRVSGTVSQDDKLVVTSKDGKTVKVYYLSMLRTRAYSTAYLAYVTSTAYTVNQQALVIKGASGQTTLVDFYSKIIPSFGAKVVVLNKLGVENKTNDLNGGDILKVTAADGLTVAYYVLDLDLTSINGLNAGLIQVYPNPTEGTVNIAGVESGNRIRTYNSLGVCVRDFVAGKSIEVVSLSDQASGLYFIVVSDAHKTLGRYKLIKQ